MTRFISKNLGHFDLSEAFEALRKDIRIFLKLDPLSMPTGTEDEAYLTGPRLFDYMRLKSKWRHF